ncbi:hypothetical protein PL85_01690 [Vibrio anguillarum]|uniref:hypothetical protein n=2 Tax=Vibrio TaxID=662 RepID=UPI000B8E9D54|nr:MULTISPECIES: hypothetical protein [Vibrio]MBF4282939.1 hypothetical protein [Vibrio anguillarum]MBF4287943.1 hypothetical protein [Vibrio anguillarum]MBF4339332.1 hypothetical protein [Vibrio anguillarum]MBF4356785.1 hypothetical protein [Vibrio anguillarum]MBF4378543.1 hypothetical protein [Vibrio anguillarum]
MDAVTQNKNKERQMKLKVALCLFLLVSLSSMANTLPALPSSQSQSPHRLFLSSESDGQQFDSWTIDGGYSYNLFDNLDLYIGARINNSDYGSESGFLSGLSYQLTPKLSLKSTLRSAASNPNNTSSADAMAAELSSRLQLSENVDLHATLDYQEWQQGVQFGVGFRF